MAVAVKKKAKVDIKLFLSCPVLLDFSILFQIFCPGLQVYGWWLYVFSNKKSDKLLGDNSFGFEVKLFSKPLISCFDVSNSVINILFIISYNIFWRSLDFSSYWMKNEISILFYIKEHVWNKMCLLQTSFQKEIDHGSRCQRAI